MLKQIGSLWKKDNGLTGVLDLGVLGDFNIGVYPNDKAEGKQPDYRIVLFPKKEE